MTIVASNGSPYSTSNIQSICKLQLTKERKQLSIVV